MLSLNELVGGRTREARMETRMTIAELAERADLSTNYLGYVERGQRGMSVGTFYKICQALERSPNDMCAVGQYSGIDNLPQEVQDFIDILTTSKEGKRAKMLKTLDGFNDVCEM